MGESGKLRAAAPVILALAAAILCSCQVRGAQLGQSPLLRFFERPSGLLLYLASDGNVHVIDQEGGTRRALTLDAGTRGDRQVIYTSTAWSPDGTQVAFSRMTLGGSNEVVDGSLFTARRDGKNLTRVLSGSRLRPFYLYWSPDSRNVSMLSSVAGESFMEMGIAPAGQEGAYRSLDQGAPCYWDWRADSRAIVVHVNTGRIGMDGERLSLLSLGTDVNRSEMKVDPGVFQAPSFSPDGTKIAYASTAQAVFTLHLSSPDGSGERALATDVGGAFLEFSRDGKRMAYLAAASLQPVPEGTLTVMDLGAKPGAQPKKQTLKEAPVLEFFWAPDGRNLVFVVPDAGDAIDPMFLRDDGFAYVRLMGLDAVTGKTWVIARFPPSRGFFDVLPFFDQYQRSSTIWSPDSKFIAFAALTDQGTPGIFVARADGNIKPRFLASGDEAFWSPR
jgi:Tol biopolymer transport system component